MAVVKEVTSLMDIKVKIVSSFPDLYVYITQRKSEAKGKDEIWYFDKSHIDKKIKFVKSLEDLKIQYVDSKNRAGWKNKSHRLQKRIC